MRAGTFTRELIRTAGEPALRRALPTWAALGVGAAVVMGPTGLQPADVVIAIDQVGAIRVTLWAAWILVSVGPVRELFAARGLDYLRSLPAARAHWWLIQGGIALALQLPWAALHAAGDGPLAGLSAGLLAAGITMMMAVHARSAVELGIQSLLIAAGAAAIVWPVEPAAAAAAAALAFVAALSAAQARAPERAAAPALPPVAGPAPVALALAHLAYLWRCRLAALGRAVLLAAVGAAFTALAARANDSDRGDGLALVALICGCIFLPLAASSVAVPIAEADRRSRWLLDATGAGTVLRVAAGAAAAGALGAILGGLFGGLIAWASAAAAPDAVRVIAAAVGGGVAWALVALAIARLAERPAGIDGTRVFAAMLGLGIAALLGVTRFGEAALLVILALGAGAPAIATARKIPSPRSRGQDQGGG